MNILTVDNITKSYGVRKIFDGASFFLQEGEKAGIIGINGTGKSTLLKIIAGLEETDDGTVIKANHCLVRYLPQNPEFAPEETVLEAVLRGNRVEENAGTIEADAKSMLTKLGVTEFDQPCGQLSGGQRKRLHWYRYYCPRRRSCYWTSLPTIWTIPCPTGWRSSCAAEKVP